MVKSSNTGIRWDLTVSPKRPTTLSTLALPKLNGEKTMSDEDVPMAEISVGCVLLCFAVYWEYVGQSNYAAGMLTALVCLAIFRSVVNNV